MDSVHQKLRDFIETLTQQECDELYKMLKTLLEEEVVFIAGPPEPLDEDDYEVMPPA
jgi:predicted amidohydrolase